MPKVSFIILNFNNPDIFLCLESIYNLDYPNFEVIVVDNASSDNSVKKIKIKFPKIKLVLNKKNLGFTGGNLAGLKKASGDLIALVNNDVVLDKNWLNVLIPYFKKNKKIAAAGGKIFYWGPKNPLYNTSNRFISWCEIDPYLAISDNQEVERPAAYVDYVSGCAMLIRADLIKKYGFLDKVFFLYYEETDLCARFLRAGYKILYTPRALCWHKALGSKKTNPSRAYFLTRNRMIFMFRNFDTWYLVLGILLFLWGEIKHILGSVVRKRDWTEEKKRWQALGWILVHPFVLCRARYQNLRKFSNTSYNNKLIKSRI